MHYNLRSARGVLYAAVLPIVVTIAWVGSSAEAGITGTPVDQIPGVPQRCPGHDLHTGDTLPTIGIAGAITNIPEFHDCQRFIKGNGYDSLFAIFAAERLDRLMDSLKSLECKGQKVPIQEGDTAEQSAATSSQVVTVVTDLAGNPLSGGVPTNLSVIAAKRILIATAAPKFVAPSDCRATSDKTWNVVGLAFGVVVSWGANYGPLGIRSGINCLYLWDSANLKAVMVPASASVVSTACTGLIDPRNTPGKSLHVVAIERPGLSGSDMPPAGRWEREPKGGKDRMYIGLKCGDKWCEVGPKGFISSPWHTASASTPLGRRVIEVKGWYDEQFLSEVDAAGKLRPTAITGTVFPHPRLAAYTDAIFDAAVWLPAAFLTLEKDHKKYKLSANLEAGGLPEVVSRAFLCKGSKEKCVPAERQSRVENCIITSGDPWYSLVISPSSDSLYECVKRQKHPGNKSAGAVRWAWSDKDEG